MVLTVAEIIVYKGLVEALCAAVAKEETTSCEKIVERYLRTTDSDDSLRGRHSEGSG